MLQPSDRRLVADPPTVPGPSVVRVELVVASLAATQLDLADGIALETLDPADRARLARLRHPADRARLVGGRRLVRETVARRVGIAPEAVRVAPDPRGRLQVAGPGVGHAVSVAHAGGVVGVAVVSRGRVGLDLEPLGVAVPATAGAAAGSTRRALETIALTLDERDELEALPAPVRDDRLLRAWTVKEAYAKLLGRGLALEIAALSLERIAARPRVAVRTLIVGLEPERYRVAVVVWSPAPAVRPPGPAGKPAIELALEVRPADGQIGRVAA